MHELKTSTERMLQTAVQLMAVMHQKLVCHPSVNLRSSRRTGKHSNSLHNFYSCRVLKSFDHWLFHWLSWQNFIDLWDLSFLEFHLAGRGVYHHFRWKSLWCSWNNACILCKFYYFKGKYIGLWYISMSMHIFVSIILYTLIYRNIFCIVSLAFKNMHWFAELYIGLLWTAATRIG